jgi:hypothetical protein
MLSGKPMLLHDTHRLFERENDCLLYNEIALSRLPEDLENKIAGVQYTCIFIPDSRGI